MDWSGLGDGAGVATGGGHCLCLRALPLHARGGGGSLQRRLSFHLGLQVEVVVGHIRQARVSRVTICCKLLLIRNCEVNVIMLFDTKWKVTTEQKARADIYGSLAWV